MQKKGNDLTCVYHPGNYDFPKTRSQIYEIAIGAILTQNTAWRNVEKALANLYNLGAFKIKNINKIDDETLKAAIKPSGYYNQKAKKIRAFNDFFRQLKGNVPSRDQLLDIWGVGPETADSILLYGYRAPSFVIDAYTRRIFISLGIIQEDMTYEEIKKWFENNLPSDVALFQEYHALIVRHAIAYYQKKADYAQDPLLTSEFFDLIK